MELECSPCRMFAVVDCTLDSNVHQGLLWHVLACDSVTLCLTFPPGRVGCRMEKPQLL